MEDLQNRPAPAATGNEGAEQSGQIQYNTTGQKTNNPPIKPDLTEARRLVDVGLKLVRLHDNTKQPIGLEWNKHAVKKIDPKATGYGLPLVANGLCSIDPDHMEMTRAGLKAWGYDLDELLAQGVRTASTRPDSGGRAAYTADEWEMARWLTFKVFDDEGNSLTVLELRAKSDNLQDCVPGVVYCNRKTGEQYTQQYANDNRFDDPPALPDDFARLWRMLSNDDDELREYDERFCQAIIDAGFKVNGKKPKHLPQMGCGESLPFEAPGYRGPFNRANSVPDVIEAHGYAYHQREKRYSHPGATGAPGIRPIPGKDDLWRSDHAGDPLHGTFDPWAAHVQLNHSGDVSEAIEAVRKQQIDNDYDELTAEAPEDDPYGLQAAKVGDLLDTDPPAREWLVTDRLPRGVVGVLAAAGGTGKSMATLQLAISVCTGLPWLEMPIDKTGAVLMFSAEDDRDEIHRRLRAVLEVYSDNIDPFNTDAFKAHKAAIAERLHVFDRVGKDNRLTAKLNGEIQRTAFVRWVVEAAQKVPDVALIVLDPLARFNGGDPNDNADSTRLIECAEQIRKATGATILLPHHVNKGSLKDPGSGQEAVRGGSGLVDGARWVGLLAGLRADQAKKEYGIDPEQAGQYVRFTTPKANYSAPWEGTWLRRLAGGALVPCELKAMKDTRQEQRAADRYAAFLVKAKEMIGKAVQKSEPLTARKLRGYAGTAGVFGMGEQMLRGCINRAIEEGAIIKGFDSTLRLG